jgi:uncharacterized membrane protein YgcG
MYRFHQLGCLDDPCDVVSASGKRIFHTECKRLQGEFGFASAIGDAMSRIGSIKMQIKSNAIDCPSVMPMPLCLRYTFTLFLMVFGTFLFPLSARSQVPDLAGRITDSAAILSAQDKTRLAQMLDDYERETTHQIAVLIVPSLSGESIDAFSLRVANAWSLGRKGVDNGILVVLAPNDRKVRIELGRGFKRYISDTQAQEIIDTQMLPALRQQEYFRALQSGLRQLMQEGRAFVAPKPLEGQSGEHAASK